MIKKAYISFLIAIVPLLTGRAQYTVNSWSGGQSVFSTYSEMVNGKTENNQSTVNIQRYNGQNNITEWKLTVRLLQDYTYNSYSVGAQNTYLQFNGQDNYSSNGTMVNVASQAVQLSKFNEVTLIHSTVPLTGSVNRVFRFNLITQGGNHLLISPNGTYYSAYEYKLYRITPGGSEQLIATRTESASGNSARFQLNYAGNQGNQNISLRNGAGIFNLQFNSVENYTNGVSVQVNNGLRVTSPSNYQLSVKASGNEMTSSTSSSTIPVSALHVELTTNQSYPGLTINSPLSLSATDQIIAIRSQYVEYIDFNLRFFIPPNALELATVPGIYTTYVYFVIIPN